MSKMAMLAADQDWAVPRCPCERKDRQTHNPFVSSVVETPYAAPGVSTSLDTNG